MRAADTPGLPVTLLVQAGQAVLTPPHFTVQYRVPPHRPAAARDRGEVHAKFATRPWPAAVPGRPVGEEVVRSFAADEQVVMTSAHCLLPLRSLG